MIVDVYVAFSRERESSLNSTSFFMCHHMTINLLKYARQTNKKRNRSGKDKESLNTKPFPIQLGVLCLLWLEKNK